MCCTNKILLFWQKNNFNILYFLKPQSLILHPLKQQYQIRILEERENFGKHLKSNSWLHACEVSLSESLLDFHLFIFNFVANRLSYTYASQVIITFSFEAKKRI